VRLQASVGADHESNTMPYKCFPALNTRHSWANFAFRVYGKVKRRKRCVWGNKNPHEVFENESVSGSNGAHTEDY
jgi:hypothetical protein